MIFISKKYDVICIGAALVDMVAKVERHPLEDDEVFVSDLALLSGGAAANTAHACAIIGLSSAFLGKLGKNDVFGNKIIEDFKNANVNTDLLKFSENFGTGSAYVALNKRGDRRIYAHSGAANYLSKEDILEKELTATKVIFLSSLKNLESFIAAANIGRKNNIPVILNPGMLVIEQGLDQIRYLLEKVDVLILSKREYFKLLNIEKDFNQGTIIEKAKVLLELPIKVLVVTLGEEGAFLLTEKESQIISSVKVDNVIDTTGAGDAFSAGFIYGFVKNLSYDFENMKQNVELGNFIAGKCIQQLGARYGIPNSEVLKKLI
jgi:ribokinase